MTGWQGLCQGWIMLLTVLIILIKLIAASRHGNEGKDQVDYHFVFAPARDAGEA